MAPSSIRRSTKIATRAQSRALGATAAKTTTKTAEGTKSAAELHRWGSVRGPLRGKLAQPKAKAQSYTAWTSFAAATDSEFDYGTYFADGAPRD